MSKNGKKPSERREKSKAKEAKAIIKIHATSACSKNNNKKSQGAKHAYHIRSIVIQPYSTWASTVTSTEDLFPALFVPHLFGAKFIFFRSCLNGTDMDAHVSYMLGRRH